MEREIQDGVKLREGVQDFPELLAGHTSSTFGLVKFWKKCRNGKHECKKSASVLPKAVLE